MTTRLDISIGPVQGFVAQSRRTRDLWGSSYLLSFLSAHAMYGANTEGGRIIQPVVDNDLLYRWVSGRREGKPPRIGSVPNHFVVEVEGDARSVADAGKRSLNNAWERVCRAVWEQFVEHICSAGEGTEHIWNRQVCAFWEVTLTAGDTGDGGGLLARRKHWRSHRPPDESGEKCTVMQDLQELSGHLRAEGRDRFWDRVRSRLGPLDLRDNERLCSIALVKRLFPKVASAALNWDVDTSHWPSTVYVGAVPWIRRVVSIAPEEGRKYADAVRDNVADNVLAERHPPFAGLNDAAAGDFPKLDANFLHREFVNSERLCPLANGNATAERKELAGLLKTIYDAEDEDGRLGPPPSFYALFLADGDCLGRLLGKPGGGTVSTALAAFTRGVPDIVKKHDGVTVYAGGDDVLAMLPVPDALACAQSLSGAYLNAFAETGAKDGATLSAAVVFAHVRLAAQLCARRSTSVAGRSRQGLQRTQLIGGSHTETRRSALSVGDHLDSILPGRRCPRCDAARWSGATARHKRGGAGPLGSARLPSA